MSEPVVGIDLGTTYSCVSIFRNGRAEAIPNDQGQCTTPSYVAFTDTVRHVGEPAKAQVVENPANTIYDAKRLIGRRFGDYEVTGDIEQWPFKVINAAGKPKVEVTYRGNTAVFCPEEISAVILEEMKSIAEKYLGEKVSKAVITVPAYFSDSQRNATKVAGEIANLEVLRIINEPTAAALAYSQQKNKEGSGEEEIKFLVFDLGGGTFDVSVLSTEDGITNVLSTAGNTHLGGVDFDNRLVEFFVGEIKRTHEVDITDDKRKIAQLRINCEKTKRLLSTKEEAPISIADFLEDGDFTSSISRQRFEELNMDLFRSTTELVAKALRDANIDKSEINEVLLVGGSTRIPKIQELLQEHFDGIELNKSLDPDEAVAHGAAIQAAILQGQDDEVKDLLLVDVVPLSLGVKTQGGAMAVLIDRNSEIPLERKKMFTTSADDQKTVAVEVYEGERPFVKDNNLLGKFELTEIPPAPSRVPKIEVTFKVDTNGILDVSAIDLSTKRSNRIEIKNSGRYTDQQIDQMVKDAEKNREEDQKLQNIAKVKDEINRYCKRVTATIKNSKTQFNKDEQEAIEKKIAEVTAWLKTNKTSEIKEYEKQRDALIKFCDPIIKNLQDEAVDDGVESDISASSDEECEVEYPSD